VVCRIAAKDRDEDQPVVANEERGPGADRIAWRFLDGFIYVVGHGTIETIRSLEINL
jgi:hypothetical protein